MIRLAGVALGLALPALAAAAWLPRGGRLAGGPLEAAGRTAAAAVVGLGVSSLLPFAWLVAGGSLDLRYAVLDALLFGGAATLGLARRLRRRAPADAPLAVDPQPWWPSAALLAALVVAVCCAAWLVRASPSGEFDAWAIWNMRARFLFRGGAAWRGAFAPELAWTSTEYPLLLPLATARLWTYAGETLLAPAALALVCTVAVPVLVAWWVAASAGARAGALAGLLVVGTPGLVSLGASQYADVPVAAFVTCGMALLTRPWSGTGGGSGRALVLAGLALGLAGWTKNEGLPAALIAVAVHAAWTWRRAGRSAAARAAGLLAAGAAPAALAWIVFHLLVTPRIAGALFIEAGGTSPAARLLDPGRWARVGEGLVLALPGARFGFPAVALILALLAGARPSRLPRLEATWVAAGMVLTAYAAFLATSWDLAWHLSTAGDRLILQLWPLVLAALFSTTARSFDAPRSAPPAAASR